MTTQFKHASNGIHTNGNGHTNGLATNGNGHTNGLATNGNGHTNGLATNGNGHTNGLASNGSAGQQPAQSEQFLRQVVDLLLEEGIKKQKDRNSKVVEFKHPKELLKCINFDLKDEGDKSEELLEHCKKTIQYSVKTGHPYFFNQLYAGYNEYGLAGAWLTETMNTSHYTYEVGPVFTVVDQVVLQKMREMIGWSSGDGLFNPGGSVSNMYGMNVARYYKYPQIKEKGMHSIPQLCVLTSVQCHYSVKKSASFLGIGSDNVIAVKCEENGKMIPEELEKAIEQCKSDGLTPFVVMATSGTTVLGAYDPLDALADICERHSLWLHTDACWGGGALMSRTHRHLLKGIERVDSVAWNPHKMMGVTLQCSAYLTKHQGLLTPCNAVGARYLFQLDKHYDVSYDCGDKSVQCGRRVDAFRFWLMWKAKGTLGFERMIDNAFNNAKYLANKIRETEGFRLVIDAPECTNICFWYIPPNLRDLEETPEWWARMSKVAPALKESMMCKGSMMIGYQNHMQHLNFFRMIVVAESVTTDDMDYVLSEIEELGKDLSF